MNNEPLVELNGFLGRAAKATYASGGGQVESQRSGFNELEYRENDWYYRDSYAGFLRSWGQEVIHHKNKPVWICSYGGGMTDKKMDVQFANQTFEFLKKVLSSGEKETEFQPRGPKDFADGDWTYALNTSGNIQKFTGHEIIQYKGETVFTHDFLGGIVVNK